jgi:hypothetical protein
MLLFIPRSLCALKRVAAKPNSAARPLRSTRRVHVVGVFLADPPGDPV